MSIAQGINKVLSIAKQSALYSGSAPTSAQITAAGTSQIFRRETGVGKLSLASFANNEITTHQQSTGKQHGLRSASYALNGVLSAGTYSTLIGSLLRKLWAAPTLIGMTAIIGTITIAIPTSTTPWIGTISFASSLGLASGLKIGDVIRLTGTASNNGINLLITAITGTLITVVTLNNSPIIAEATIATGLVTITFVGKKTFAASTSQTQEYWMIEDYHSDITQSELYSDMVVSSVDLTLPASGNVTIANNFVGLNRSTTSSQKLISGTPATTSSILTAVQGDIVINGIVVANITGATIKMDCAAANMGGVLGTNFAPDIQRAVISVSGQVTAFYQDGILPGYFDNSTDVSIILVVAADNTKTSDFIAITLPSVIFDGDDKDDGLKGIVRTYPFTARRALTGGAGTINEQTIISIQDSLA